MPLRGPTGSPLGPFEGGGGACDGNGATARQRRGDVKVGSKGWVEPVGLTPNERSPFLFCFPSSRLSLAASHPSSFRRSFLSCFFPSPLLPHSFVALPLSRHRERFLRIPAWNLHGVISLSLSLSLFLSLSPSLTLLPSFFCPSLSYPVCFSSILSLSFSLSPFFSLSPPLSLFLSLTLLLSFTLLPSPSPPFSLSLPLSLCL